MWYSSLGKIRLIFVNYNGRLTCLLISGRSVLEEVELHFVASWVLDDYPIGYRLERDYR